MCGICGIVDLSAPERLPRELAAMTGLVAHRGPDDEGLALFAPGDMWASGIGEPPERGWTVGLGHRRLSIIDLSPAGHQPLADCFGRYWIVLNGEIYNFVELRQELEGLGYRFRSRSDTEVVLAAYTLWGESCLTRFNGMWAFAIYDREQATLFCARDRFGVKPFYYSIQPGRFAFSSEIKQLNGQTGRATANRELLADFFFWKYETHTPQTFFEGIVALPPSHCLTVSLDTLAAGRAQSRAYWQPTPGPRLEEPAAVQRFGELLEDAVRLRLRSDVPVGVTLSGGLDSSSVTCLASPLYRSGGAGELMAFTAVFPDAGFSEQPFAELVTGMSGAKALYIHPESGALTRDWGRYVWNMEEPFSSLAYYANWTIYQKIRAYGIPVILNGQGGDELLLGYDRYRVPYLAMLAREGRWGQALDEMRQARSHASMGYLRQLLYIAYFSSPAVRAVRRRRLVRPFLRREFYEFGRSRLGHMVRESRNRDRLDWQRKELFEYQLPHLLHHEDRVSMSFSTESRSPFLDYRLLEFVLGQPVGYLIRDGWSKRLLREAMRGVIPEGVRIRRDKMGFDTPTGRLLRESQLFFVPLLRRNADDPLLDVQALESAYLRGSADEELLCSALSYLSWKETFGVSI